MRELYLSTISKISIPGGVVLDINYNDKICYRILGQFLMKSPLEAKHRAGYKPLSQQTLGTLSIDDFGCHGRSIVCRRGNLGTTLSPTKFVT